MFAIGHNLDKTARGRAAGMQAQHNLRGKLAGSHLHDLIALGKAILLSEDEAKKFMPTAKAHGYWADPTISRVNGYSDVSGAFQLPGILFQKKG
jgi:hypothetical protein